MKKPIIGITAHMPQNDPVFQLNPLYAKQITAAGGYPVILAGETVLPPFLDGLLLSGGCDILPQYYHEEPHPLCAYTDPKRDSIEFALCRMALRQKLPVLGICRGMQVMAVCCGGSLYQDIRLQNTAALQHMQNAPRHCATHRVFLRPHSRLYRLLGSEALVNSFHHQSVKDCGDAFFASAFASDGVIEAIEHRTHPFAIGVQWHPEAMRQYLQQNIFLAFLQAAACFHRYKEDTSWKN